MTVIKDGTGQGYLAEVDATNRLKVECVSTIDAAEAADLGIAYCVDGILTGITNIEKTVLVLVNNSTPIEIGRSIVSVQGTIPLATSNGAIIRIYHGQATTSGGTTKTPINSNSSSLNVANVTVSTNGPTISGTDNEIMQFYILLNDLQYIDFAGTIVLGQSGSFRITCQTNGTAGPLGNCAVSLQFFGELP